ncbi:hypothetical protein [Streptomyces naphthomycinicus]|uniref:hypothetical protein n=1 Tax=Streptomyces naphthomycinicus TaxID=2872625 RepID=UPI001CEC60CF|nr:hypothetical protein [Streptomyces sp. TML10]
MSPEHRTTPRPGSADHGGFRRVRRLAAIATAMTVAVGTPAVAVAVGVASQAGVAYAADPHCDHDKPRHGGGEDGCDTSHPKPTVTVTRTATATATVTATTTATATATVTATATACGTGVDSTKPNGMEQFLAALVDGVPFAGRRPNTNTNPDNPNIVSGPANAAGWTDLSTIAGFPTNSPVCDVSVDAQGSDAFYKVITQGGSVYTLHCAANGTTLECPAPAQGTTPQSQWVAVTPQP